MTHAFVYLGCLGLWLLISGAVAFVVAKAIHYGAVDEA